MGKVGGVRQGAGRRVGSVSRRNAEVVAASLAEGITPVEYMLKILRDEEADAKDRAWAAEKAAPYLHPRPAPLERTIEIALPDTSTVEGIAGALDRIIKAMSKGDISPSEGQSLIAVIEARRKPIETGELLDRVKRLEEARPAS